MGGTYSRSKYDKTKYHVKYFDEMIPPDAASGKTIAVTGATANGLGLWCAKHAMLLGAKRVILLNRKSARSEAAVEEVTQFARDSGKQSCQVVAVECDLLSFKSVRAAAAELNAFCKDSGLDVLCLNAGTMAAPDETTTDGYNREAQVNVLAQQLLLKEVFQSLKKASDLNGESRIVQHSSGARHIPKAYSKGKLVTEFFEKMHYSDEFKLPLGLSGDKVNSGMVALGPAWRRYGQTKLANSMLTELYREKLTQKGYHNIKAVVASPGLAASELQSTTNGTFRTMKAWECNVAFFLAGQGVRDGSLPITNACFHPDVQSGDFYEPKTFTTYGPPVPIATGGIFKDPKGEKDTISDLETKGMMWEVLGEACGGEVF